MSRLRRPLVVSATALVALTLASAGGAARADESIVVSPHDTRAKATKGNYDGVEFRLIVTGTFTIEYASGVTAVYDALYCFKGCGSTRERRSPLEMFVPGNNQIPSTQGGLWDWEKTDVPYNAAHRYELGPFNTAHTDLFPQMQFQISRSYRDCRDCRFSGMFSIRIVPGKKAETEEQVNLRVDFLVRASGKPNLPISGAGPQPASSRLTASGHATFTKKKGNRLEATATKGSVVHTEGGLTMKLGIISGSMFFPATRRLVLLLKVNESNDPRCEASGFLTGVRAATLTLLPVSGEPDLGTAIFVGVPITKTLFPGLSVTPCKGHSHGWRGGDGAAVRIVIRESKP